MSFNSKLGLAMTFRRLSVVFIALVVVASVASVVSDVVDGKRINTEWFGPVALLLMGFFAASLGGARAPPSKRAGSSRVGIVGAVLLFGGIVYVMVTGDQTAQFMAGLLGMVLAIVIAFFSFGFAVDSSAERIDDDEKTPDEKT